MSTEEEDAAVQVMIRTLDAWFLLSPTLARDAVVAWLESIEAVAEPADTVLDASEIGDDPVTCGVPDASENLDKYLYGGE